MRSARLTLCITFALVLFITVPGAYAQQGCVNSPENPTAVLLLIGAAGMVLPSLRQRRAARKNSSLNR